MSHRWMVVHEDMTWDEVDFKNDETSAKLYFFKKKQEAEVKIVKENEFTKVFKLKDLVTQENYELVDFKEFDKFLENNKIIFANRRGLHKELRRYINFSLKK